MPHGKSHTQNISAQMRQGGVNKSSKPRQRSECSVHLQTAAKVELVKKKFCVNPEDRPLRVKHFHVVLVLLWAQALLCSLGMGPGRGHRRNQEARCPFLTGMELSGWSCLGCSDGPVAVPRCSKHEGPVIRSRLESRAASPLHSHGIIEHNILFGELQQHRIIEELADTHIFTQAL